ncbi:MAG: ATP-binding protein [Coleofasciculaceae cyanobacterium]
MELLIFIGLQASGKSTFYQKNFATTHKLVSKDLMPNHKNRTKRQAQLIAQALESGHSVVVDNTNPTREERAILISLGQQYHAQISGYYFQSYVSRCLERNQQRQGKEKVPDVGIYATSRKLERPELKEGFDQLFYIKFADNNEFIISPWNQELADG